MMNAMRIFEQRDKMAGLLVLLGLLAGILSISPAVDSKEYLTEVVVDSFGVRMSAVFQFILFLTYIGFALLLFPIVKRKYPEMALGFLCSRIIAGGILILGIVIMLSIMVLGQELEVFDMARAGSMKSVANMLKEIRDQINHVFMVLVLGTGNLMMYWMLLRSGLLPQWLSLWGIFGALMSMDASILVLFDHVDVITKEYLLLNAPTALFELLFGLWLLIKGLKQSRTVEMEMV